MKIIVCLDDRNGMLFNKRRQSRDAVACEKIRELAEDSVLHMNGYSAKLFSDADVKVSEDFLSMAQPEEFCFVEDRDIMPYIPSVESIYVFRWNRKYPADMYFPEQLLGWDKKILAEFAGKSHDKITLEVYTP